MTFGSGTVRVTSKIAAMVIALLVGAALSSPAKGLLVVDMLAIGRYDGGWRKIEPEAKDPVSKITPLNFWRFGEGSIYGVYENQKLDLLVDAAPGWYLTDSKLSSMVLWSGARPAVPATQRLGANSATYLKVVQDHLKSKGLKAAKARISQIFSVDLDGDGTKEILIEAAPKADMTEETMEKATGKDYTVVLLRYAKGGRAVTKVLAHHDGRTGTLEVADRIRGFADLNGDGVAEIVLSSNYYEGTSATVLNFKRGQVKKLIENGSGL